MNFDEKLIALARIDNCGVNPREGKWMLTRHGKDILFHDFQECVDRLKILYSPMLSSRDALLQLIGREDERGIEKIAQLLIGARQLPQGMQTNWTFCVSCLMASAEELADAYLKFKGFE